MLHIVGGPGEGRFKHLLRGGRGIGDEGHRLVGAAPGSDQPRGDRRDMFHRHVHDDHLAATGHTVPIDPVRHDARRIMTGQKGDCVIGVAMGYRDAGIGEPADTGSDPWHDPERNMMLDQRQRFLAATAEDERVAALEPQDPVSFARQFDQSQ
jgi:hypothetical protein